MRRGNYFSGEGLSAISLGTLEYLKTLNASQRAAVECLEGPTLIIAGAGSGKTRVLTNRIVHLIHQRKADLSQIFAVTFTNKAAAEMRHRVQELLLQTEHIDIPINQLWVSTFHSACMRILRSDIHHLGYQNQFTIYDDSDQLSAIKAVMRELNIADNLIPPKSIQSKINKMKNDCLDLAAYKPKYTSMLDELSSKVFLRYQEVLQISSAVDFADLIYLTVELFKKFPVVLRQYQLRFPYVLIDEYQDTNKSQYQLVKLLAGEKANICAVGDEDQSIYRWRGADITNILNFEVDYPNAKIFKLEQNYRSTKNIIEAASHVIGHNTERRKKELWTDNLEGEKIQVYECYDEHDEAFKVCKKIEESLQKGTSIDQVAIFYRTNAQSRLFEDRMRSMGLNYQIYGGLKFYERLEIKDSLAYLKLINNPDDDVSFRRIINVPTRGIGAVSLEKLQDAARQHGLGLMKTLEAAFGPRPTIALDLGRGQKNIAKFYELMKKIFEAKDSVLPSELLNFVLHESNYRKSLLDEATVESKSRLENLQELRQSMVEYELRVGAEKPNENITLQGFLEEIALVSDLDKKETTAPSLKMMTIHMAKGLEFNEVYIVGLEEELFPSVRSWEFEDPQDVEEERRLFYVGMTRARKNLSLFYAKNRTIYGNSQFRVSSRFLEEVPEHYVELHKADYFSRKKPFNDQHYIPKKFEEDFSQLTDYGDSDIPSEDELIRDRPELKEGHWISHPMFGEGVIQKRVGKDKLVVLFQSLGVKKISLKFSQVEPVSR